MWEVSRRVGRDEENVGKYGRCWNVGKVWKSVLECGGGMGSVGSMDRCVSGVGRDVENVLGWREMKKSGRYV